MYHRISGIAIRAALGGVIVFAVWNLFTEDALAALANIARLIVPVGFVLQDSAKQSFFIYMCQETQRRSGSATRLTTRNGVVTVGHAEVAAHPGVEHMDLVVRPSESAGFHL
jgi:hypothetical protein